jgi:hypothetical protein
MKAWFKLPFDVAPNNVVFDKAVIGEVPYERLAF